MDLVVHVQKTWLLNSNKSFVHFILFFGFLSYSLIVLNAQDIGNGDGADIIINVNATPYTISFYLNDTDTYEILNVTCKNAKFLDESNADTVCEDLTPCTTFLATLYISDILNDKVYKKDIDVKTEHIDPSITIINVDAGVDEMYVTWNSTDKTCIDTYRIEIISADYRYVNTFYIDEQPMVITSLDPCQTYFIELQAYSNNKTFVSNSTNTTLYGEPSNVEMLKILPYENAQVKVTWIPPTYRTCIDFYYLKWYRIECPDIDNVTNSIGIINNLDNSINADADDQCESHIVINESNAKEYIISGLHGCDDYLLEVHINGVDNLKSDITPFKSPEQTPGPVKINSPDLYSTNVTLYWDPPEFNTKCILHYKINIIGPLQRNDDKVIVYETRRTYLSVPDLAPCGKYNFSVIPYSLNGTLGPNTNSSFELLQAKASTVRDVITVASTHDVTISWNPPLIADLCIKSYRLAGWNNETSSEFHNTTAANSITITGLFSCLVYEGQIIATNDEMDGELEHFEFETTAALPAKVDEYKIVAHYSNALEFSAIPNDRANYCKIIFARFVCTITNTSLDVRYKMAEKYVQSKIGGLTFNAIVSPLSPNTEYRCSVALFNVAGWSEYEPALVKTRAYFPGMPAQINLIASTNYSVQFAWKEPKYPNGNVNLYNIHFERVEAAYYIPPSCNLPQTEPNIAVTAKLTESFNNLLPYTRYSFQLAAQNEYGVGEYSRPYMVVTKSFVSEPIRNLKLTPEGPYGNADEVYKANVLVSWMMPCRSNGEIENFELEFIGKRVDYELHNFKRSVLPKFTKDGIMEYNETDLRPEYNYDVCIAVHVRDVKEGSILAEERFDSPAGIPLKLNETSLEKTRVYTRDSIESNNPTSSAVVYLPADILDSDSGKIIYMALLLSEKDCNGEPEMQFGPMNTLNINQWPSVPTWNDAYNNPNCVMQYQTTPKQWMPKLSTRIARDETVNEIKYIIGDDKCDSEWVEYCNGPLKADTEYYLVVRLFTKSGYNDAALLKFKTDALIKLKIILISVSSCFLLALIIGIIYLWITKRIRWQRDCSMGIEDSFGNVNSKNFAVFYNEVAKPEKISREFKELTNVAMDLSCSASELGTSKNRYADIFPYDKNRVILDIDADGSDYINASFIDGYRRRKEYIATQGPKPDSVIDFWRMVLQHNVRVIVMVTQLRELDVVKCHEYYPYKSKGINVVIKKTDTFELYDRSEMLVTHDIYGLKQKVVHFYFKKWPDHGCPSDPMNLINFVRKVKSEKIPSYCPIAIHCSAGVGRTGTFIALDIIMQRLKSESKVNIYEIVKKLRFQRMKMVQSLSQYTFLYQCTFELVKHKIPRSGGPVQKPSDKKVSFEDEDTNQINRNKSLNNECIISDLNKDEEENDKWVEHNNNYN